MKPPRFKSPRLLPIVIFAAVALLAFKGIGLITNGGYVLTGTIAARASEPAAPAATTSDVPNAAPGTEPTMADTSPTLTDSAPTLPGAPAGERADAAAKGEKAMPAATAHDAASAGTAADRGSAQKAADDLTAAAAPAVETAICPPDAPAADSATAAANPSVPAAGVATPGVNCDAAVSRRGPDGKVTPIDGASPTEQTLLQRLGERRTELDKREANINMREAIVKAAEKQMQERADALKTLEAQISHLNDEKAAMQDSQFAGIVKMYETMKPQEAAAIFDGLDMTVLARVAKAMDPRKMSPVLAKMSSARAQQLTTQLAGTDAPAAANVASADTGALPQIIGH